MVERTFLGSPVLLNLCELSLENMRKLKILSHIEKNQTYLKYCKNFKYIFFLFNQSQIKSLAFYTSIKTQIVIKYLKGRFITYKWKLISILVSLQKRVGLIVSKGDLCLNCILIILTENMMGIDVAKYIRPFSSACRL